MLETLFPVLNPEPWEPSNIALRFKTVNNIYHFIIKGLYPNMDPPHLGGLKNLLYVLWGMMTCIQAEDSFDSSESGGSTLLRNVRTYIVSYSSRRKTALPHLGESPPLCLV